MPFAQELLQAAQVLNQTLQFAARMRLEQQQQEELRAYHAEALQAKEAALKARADELDALERHRQVEESLQREKLDLQGQLGDQANETRQMAIAAATERAKLKAVNNGSRASLVQRQVNNALGLQSPKRQGALEQELQAARRDYNDFTSQFGGEQNIKGPMLQELGRLKTNIANAEGAINQFNETKRRIVLGLQPEDRELYFGKEALDMDASLAPPAPPAGAQEVSANAPEEAAKASMQAKLFGDLDSLSAALAKNTNTLKQPASRVPATNALRDIITNYKRSGQSMDTLVTKLKNLTSTNPNMPDWFVKGAAAAAGPQGKEFMDAYNAAPGK